MLEPLFISGLYGSIDQGIFARNNLYSGGYPDYANGYNSIQSTNGGGFNPYTDILHGGVFARR